jgi:RNase P/RNase MRP subunit p30
MTLPMASYPQPLVSGAAHHVGQSPSAGDDHLKVALAVHRIALQQTLREANDAVQRRLQLVRRVRKELVLKKKKRVSGSRRITVAE